MMARVWVIIALFLILPTVQAQKVEEISSFKITVDVNSLAHVRYDVTLKNLIDKPVVPGIGEIRLQKAEPIKVAPFSVPFTEERKPVKVTNAKAYSENRNFKVTVEEKDDYTLIVYEIWYPIEPKGEMNFTVEYDADIVDSGLLFKSVTIPVGTDTDIRNLEITVNSDWKLTYAEPPASNSPMWRGSIPAGGIAFYTAEFSILPLPILPVRGYVVFWGTLLALAAILLLIRLRRMRAISLLFLIFLISPSMACIYEYREAIFYPNATQEVGRDWIVVNFTNPYPFNLYDVNLSYRNEFVYIPFIPPNSNLKIDPYKILTPQTFPLEVTSTAGVERGAVNVSYTIKNNYDKPVEVRLEIPKPANFQDCVGCEASDVIKFHSTIPAGGEESFSILVSGNSARISDSSLSFSLTDSVPVEYGVDLVISIEKQRVGNRWFATFRIQNPLDQEGEC